MADEQQSQQNQPRNNYFVNNYTLVKSPDAEELILYKNGKLAHCNHLSGFDDKGMVMAYPCNTGCQHFNCIAEKNKDGAETGNTLAQITCGAGMTIRISNRTAQEMRNVIDK